MKPGGYQNMRGPLAPSRPCASNRLTQRYHYHHGHLLPRCEAAENAISQFLRL